MTDTSELEEKHSKTIRLRLPLELQYELISTLPFEHCIRSLSLSKSIAKSCNLLARKQSEGWKLFSGKCIERLMKHFHPRVAPTLESIEEEHHSLYLQRAQREDTYLNEHIENARTELSPLLGQNLVRRVAKCKTAGEAMNELFSSAANMHHFIEKSKIQMKQYHEQFNVVKQLANEIRLDLIPRDVPLQLFPTGTAWSIKRLRRDYSEHLRLMRFKLRETKRAHCKKLNQIGVCKQVLEWYNELQMHRNIILEQWKAIQKKKSEFDVAVWCERMLSELQAKNALTIEKSEERAKCRPCMLRKVEASS